MILAKLKMITMIWTAEMQNDKAKIREHKYI